MVNKHSRFASLWIMSLVLLTHCYAGQIGHTNEWRIGVLRHDTKIDEGGLERSFALNTEYLWSSPTQKIWTMLFRPRPHLGLNINTDHRTSSAYIGFTWSPTFSSNFFWELSLGGAAHNGKLNKPSRHRKAQGSRVLFREALGIGYECPNHETIMLYAEHQSNCKLASPNPGITSVGIRFGIPLN